MAKKKTRPSGTNLVAQARKSSGGGRSSGSLKWWWDGFRSLAGAVAIYLVIRTLLMEAFRIPSPSMVPTLLVGDWLFVSKVAYGPHIPWTNKHIPGYTSPTRGDVVVFQSPYQPDMAERGEDPRPTLVKRLIGMPGDTMYMRDGLLHINGIAQRQGYGVPASPADNPNLFDPLMDWQHRIELTGTRFGKPPTRPTLGNWGPLLIPSGHYFMMGDNRYGSKDSRYWGVVPRENIRGRPMFIYYSFVGGGESDRPLPALTDIRWTRLGHWVR